MHCLCLLNTFGEWQHMNAGVSKHLLITRLVRGQNCKHFVVCGFSVFRKLAKVVPLPPYYQSISPNHPPILEIFDGEILTNFLQRAREIMPIILWAASQCRPPWRAGVLNFRLFLINLLFADGFET